MSTRRKSVNFIPKGLPLDDEDGNIDIGRVWVLDKAASQLLLAEVKAAIKGRTPPGNFRSPDPNMSTLEYSLTPIGKQRFIQWNKECAVYRAVAMLQGNLDQFQLSALRQGLSNARRAAVTSNTKITEELKNRYWQEAKLTTSQKQLGSRLGITQPTLRKLQDELGVIRKK